MSDLITKFTKSGDKVVLLEELNKGEWIVQKMFVCKDKEFPSGNKFVCKDLLDSPPISWKEQNLKDLDAKYEKERRRLEDKYTLLTKEYKLSIDNLDNVTKYFKSLSKVFDSECLDTLINLLTGKITHVYCKSDYGDYNEILSLEEALRTGEYDGGLKLLSLFGSSKGDLSFRINRYKDGSGDWREVSLHSSYESALNEAQKHYEEKEHKFLNSDETYLRYDTSRIKGIIISDKAKEKLATINNKQIEKRISELKEQLNKLEKEYTE